MCRDGMRAVNPRFAAVVEELHRHKEPPARVADEADEFDTAPVAMLPLPNEVGASQDLGHVMKAESQPCRPSLSDMSDTLGGDADGSVCFRQPPGQLEVAWNESRDLIPGGVPEHLESAWHPRRRSCATPGRAPVPG
jgi:hypothetical protein